MKRNILVLSMLIIHANTFSCDCEEIERDSAVVVGLKNSDIAFMGNLIKSDFGKNTYCFEIFEIFKGEYIRDTIWGASYSDCAIFPSEKGIWIVYADMLNDTTIEINGCYSSLSLQHPEGILPPPPEYYNEDENRTIKLLEYKIQVLEKRSAGFAMWFSDYEKLRKYKSESKSTSNTIISTHYAPRIIHYLILFLLATNLITLIVLIRRK